jgi:hypothetical protein
MKLSHCFLCLALFACSCTTQDVCEEDSISELVASFKTETGGILHDTTLSALKIYGIREGQDIWYLYDTVSGSQILLPLDPHHDASRFVFQTTGQTDTLTLGHSSELYLISYACGFGQLFSLGSIQYKGGMIVKDSILNPVISTSLEKDEIHIWLYF